VPVVTLTIDRACRGRLRPAILPTLAAAACIALFVAAGLWQHGRMEQKLALRAQLDAAAALPPSPLPATMDWTGWRYRQVALAGTFDAAHQILLDNRVHEGRAGYEVFAPLALDDGRTVLVDRGWVVAGPTRAELPAVPPPTGPVTVPGRINQVPAYVELAAEAPTGPLWQHLDLARYAKATGLAVLPVIVEQSAPAAPGDALVRDLRAPDVGVDTHRIYMVQWFTFAAMVAGLWLYFTWKRSR
jgi:surfeit locus 1 family protein